MSEEDGPLLEDANPMFLVAVPQLGDPNFARSVVLILHHGEQGALGLVINNTTELDLGTFARSQELPCHGELEDVPVFRGGPVEPHRGWILHSRTDVEERREILPGLFVSGTADSLRQILERGQGPVRLLLGYAGWAPGQLEAEMAEGAWLAMEANVRHVLETDPATAWRAVLDDMGVDPARLAQGSGVH